MSFGFRIPSFGFAPGYAMPNRSVGAARPWRLAVAVFAGLGAALAGCEGGPAGGDDDAAAAAAVWPALRDAILRKDWDAVWELCTPESRQQFGERMRKIAEGGAEGEAGLRLMGIPRADLKTMDAKTFYAKSMRLFTENERFRTSWEQLKDALSGKRVERVERMPEGQAVLTLRDAGGNAESLRAWKVDGRWCIHFPLAP
jgi:hypothetical protein